MSLVENMNTIHLLGNPEENFYALGKKDVVGFEHIFDQMTMLCARNDTMSKVFKMALELSANFQPKGSVDLKNQLKAYAEGLEKPINDVYFALLLPEIVAAFNKWSPNLMGIIPGCSSLFLWDKDHGGVVHGRVLDYALAGPFERFERSILYEFTNRFKVYSHSTAGMPFPALTAMNEKGLTLALHYKHGDYFDLSGDSIFNIAYQVISYCSDIHEVRKYLKAHPSMSYWGMYLSDANGHVASIDISGNEIYQEKFDLKEHKYLYFNNRPLLKEKKHSEIQPFGNLDQCKMRFKSIKEEMASFKNSKKLDLDVIKLLTTPNVTKATSASHWKLSPMTPSSIQVTSFHNKLMQSYFVPGGAPKMGHSELVLINNLFGQQSLKTVKSKSKLKPDYCQGYRCMAMAQSYFDGGKIEKAYHQLQMAMEYHKDYPEYYIEKFFFTVWQYMYDSGQKDFVYLYDDFISLENKLPPYLEDHRQLFLLRLGKILGHDVVNNSIKVQNEQLRNYYNKEYKMKGVAIKMLRKLIFPRLEIIDIIYMY
jgi:hypothetical protein